MPRKINFFIDNNYDGLKIKDYLKIHHFSHRIITVLKREDDGILLNGEHARSIDVLRAGDKLVLSLPDDDSSSVSVPVKIPLDIIYEDDDILVIDKQAMIAMHETHNHQGDALSNAVAYHLKNEGKSAVFRAVGRLDKGTSGIVVCALNKYAASCLSGKIYKEYLAIASGVFSGDGTIDAPICRPDPMKTLRAVGVGGEKAITHWKAIKNDGQNTLLRIHLETGRTHQIRVHFLSLGAPLVGDRMYGQNDDRINHQSLHCCYVRFSHPITGEQLEFSAEIPQDMAEIIK